jgi:hypothetical protein
MAGSVYNTALDSSSGSRVDTAFKAIRWII